MSHVHSLRRVEVVQTQGLHPLVLCLQNFCVHLLFGGSLSPEHQRLTHPCLRHRIRNAHERLTARKYLHLFSHLYRDVIVPPSTWPSRSFKRWYQTALGRGLAQEHLYVGTLFSSSLLVSGVPLGDHMWKLCDSLFKECVDSQMSWQRGWWEQPERWADLFLHWCSRCRQVLALEGWRVLERHAVSCGLDLSMNSRTWSFLLHCCMVL